jgi:hypothetical protein
MPTDRWTHCILLVYARHGRELMGYKSPVRESCQRAILLAQVLAEGKGGTARDRLEEGGAQSDEPTNRNGNTALSFMPSSGSAGSDNCPVRTRIPDGVGAGGSIPRLRLWYSTFVFHTNGMISSLSSKALPSGKETLNSYRTPMATK